jgi:alpha-tubulin suppressor-like RCC1 family protein
MGGKSRVWIFGDIPFLQNSFHINKQLNPRDMGWDDVEKIACGSTHLLLLQKDSNNLYNIMSVGNGMFGKLGDGDETGKNHYEPIRVELPYFEIKYKSDVKLRASKYTSAALIKDYSNKSESIDNNTYKLYMWGLCQHELFSNLKDV